MKTRLSIIFCFISIIIVHSQGPSHQIEDNFSYKNTINKIEDIESNGYSFELLDAGVNSKYSEFASGFFRSKLIVVSSKKLGGLSNMDPKTNEAYKNLFCLNVDKNGQLSKPLLFSRILNTKSSEGQLAFSPDQKTVYYTRSNKTNSLEYKLYKAVLQEGSHGNWINEELLDINGYSTSIEHPFINSKGDKLYFSSNMADAVGGFDIYVSNIKTDGTLDIPVNLGNTVNTKEDEKYPSLSKDDKQLYFSSRGHHNMGGYDIFVSNILNKSYNKPRNLGNTINSPYDEVAYFLATKNKGYVSSNKQNGKGGFDIYTAVKKEIKQTIKGKTLDLKTKAKLPNTLVILKDKAGNEISWQVSNHNASYSFDITPSEDYIITTKKDGFKNADFEFSAYKNSSMYYNKDLELNTLEPEIALVDNKLMIIVENIYFDSNKHSIKEESLTSLDKVVKILKQSPKARLTINAHTDNKGDDSYNLELSGKRANSTLKYLVENGISKNRLQSKGYGEEAPLVDCKENCSDNDLQTNRRIEFIIKY